MEAMKILILIIIGVLRIKSLLINKFIKVNNFKMTEKFNNYQIQKENHNSQRKKMLQIPLKV